MLVQPRATSAESPGEERAEGSRRWKLSLLSTHRTGQRPVFMLSWRHQAPKKLSNTRAFYSTKM